jgi:hypothetical protein
MGTFSASVRSLETLHAGATDRRRHLGKRMVTEFVTLDGVIEDPGGSEGFDRGMQHRRGGDPSHPSLCLPVGAADLDCDDVRKDITTRLTTSTRGR